MKQYYYTVSSLPALRFDETPFLDIATFLSMCRIEVTPEDMEVITKADFWPSEIHADQPVSHWERLIREFRIHAAYYRAQILGWDTERFPRPEGLDAGMQERVRAIFNEDNPLKIELALLRWLWQIADDLSSSHMFDREKLIAYHLMLQIAWRRVRLMDAQAGNEEFDRHYHEIIKPLAGIAS